MTEMLSLLWLESSVHTAKHYDEFLIADLNLSALIRHLSFAPQYEKLTRHLLLSLCTDEAVIRYRQAVLADMLRSPRLMIQLETALEAIETLEGYLTQPQWRDNPL